MYLTCFRTEMPESKMIFKMTELHQIELDFINTKMYNLKFSKKSKHVLIWNPSNARRQSNIDLSFCFAGWQKQYLS